MRVNKVVNEFVREAGKIKLSKKVLEDLNNNKTTLIWPVANSLELCLNAKMFSESVIIKNTFPKSARDKINAEIQGLKTLDEAKTILSQYKTVADRFFEAKKMRTEVKRILRNNLFSQNFLKRFRNFLESEEGKTMLHPSNEAIDYKKIFKVASFEEYLKLCCFSKEIEKLASLCKPYTEKKASDNLTEFVSYFIKKKTV